MLKDEIIGLKERGTTVLFSTHRMESVEELCDEIALINHAEVVLSGNKLEVQSRFKKNQYVIRFAGELAEIPGIEVLSTSSGQATLRFAAGLSSNEAIGQLIQQVNLLEFNELIPSFNDIFIQVVNETNAK
jgi:ABC-2 type transport system ATP-binding protein